MDFLSKGFGNTVTTIRPTLTIAIPTYNRAPYLALLLGQLDSEIRKLPEPGRIEALVSDNDSTDDTPRVVADARKNGLNLRYLRNPENIGSDRNIAQCFNEATGRYVLIMGDDDLLADGTLPKIIDRLERTTAGVVLLQPYGYDFDFRAERPRNKERWVDHRDVASFLLRAGPLITLISACAIRKEILQDLDAAQFVGGHLVQVHLVLRALLRAKTATSYEGFVVACKRNNSGGYAFSDVFVRELGSIFDRYRNDGLGPDLVRRYEARLLASFYPYYVWRQMPFPPADLARCRADFETRFRDRWEYRLSVAPMFWLPGPLGRLWGGFATLMGRALGGDLWRGMHFLWFRLGHLVQRAIPRRESGRSR
jgi:abequosyltransferase